MPTLKMVPGVRGRAGRPKAILCWSSGKDSALALHRILASETYDVVSLVTTVTEGVRRVSMHGVREQLLDLQAASLRLPLQKVPLPHPCPNAVYEQRLQGVFSKWRKKGVTHVVFGDLFLQDIRRYREEKLTKGILEPLFPLWQADTSELAQELISLGFKALLICVDTKKLPASLTGSLYNEDLLKALPAGVDPCGEYGEFHTFVFGGPIFQQPLAVELGERVSKQGFEFLDLYPADPARELLSRAGT